MKKLALLMLLLLITMTGAAQANKHATIAAKQFKAKVVNQTFLDPGSYRLIKIQPQVTITNERIYQSQDSKLTTELESLQSDIRFQVGYINRMKQAQSVEARTDGPNPSVAWGDPEADLAVMFKREAILINNINQIRSKLTGSRVHLNQPAGYIFLLNAYANDQYSRRVIVQYAFGYLIKTGIVVEGIQKIR
jgi:hypothetical protein